ncbi:MAG: hypothetical protein OEV28_08795, partial [Nitrospirota bacterium]|nr:hypothetical protein [Nitrospirota bacterium]
DIEQLANLEVRWAVQKWEDKDGNPRSILTTIDGAIRRLEELLKNFSPTAERYSLLGSAFKHRARVDVKDRGISLKKMSDAYEEGYALSLRSGSLNPYPLLNKLAGDLAIAWHKGKAPSKAEVDQLRKVLDEARPKVLQLSAVKKDFWHAVYPVDLELLSVLLSGAPSETRMNELADSYNELKKLSNPRDFESVVDQFDYLIEMAEKNTKVSNALVRLKKKVEKSS